MRRHSDGAVNRARVEAVPFLTCPLGRLYATHPQCAGCDAQVRGKCSKHGRGRTRKDAEFGLADAHNATDGATRAMAADPRHLRAEIAFDLDRRRRGNRGLDGGLRISTDRSVDIRLVRSIRGSSFRSSVSLDLCVSASMVRTGAATSDELSTSSRYTLLVIGGQFGSLFRSFAREWRFDGWPVA